MFCVPACGQPVFSARFFLVVIEATPTGRSLLHMWLLQLSAQPVASGTSPHWKPCLHSGSFRRTCSSDTPALHTDSQLLWRILTPPLCSVLISLSFLCHVSLCGSGEAPTPSGRNSSGSGFSFERLGSPASAQRSGAAPCGLHSACRLALHSARVFSQELELPPGVEVIRVTPAAGELPTHLFALLWRRGWWTLWRCFARASEQGCFWLALQG